MIYIGIDPGTDTGIAVWDSKSKKFTFVGVLKIHRAMDMVHELVGEHHPNISVRVEDARKRKFFKGISNAEMDAKQQGAGSIKRDSAIWDDLLADIGCDYEMRTPCNTKIDYARFVKFTKHTDPILFHGKRTKSEYNMQHATDAAMTVYNL